MIKTGLILVLGFLSFPSKAQNNGFIEEIAIQIRSVIEDYMGEFNYDRNDTFSENIDDESHNYTVYFKKDKIVSIDDDGADEFRSFSYSFKFRNDSLIYAYSYSKRLLKHWSEYQDNEEEEFVICEGECYYFRDKIELWTKLNSDSDQQTSDNYCDYYPPEPKLAYELLSKFSLKK